jgi:hypothetical protein
MALQGRADHGGLDLVLANRDLHNLYYLYLERNYRPHCKRHNFRSCSHNVRHLIHYKSRASLLYDLQDQVGGRRFRFFTQTKPCCVERNRFLSFSRQLLGLRNSLLRLTSPESLRGSRDFYDYNDDR